MSWVGAHELGGLAMRLCAGVGAHELGGLAMRLCAGVGAHELGGLATDYVLGWEHMSWVGWP